MSRSIKKGPYVHASLQKKIEALNASNDKKVVKTWSRSSTILPDFLGHTIAATRTYKGHADKSTSLK